MRRFRILVCFVFLALVFSLGFVSADAACDADQRIFRIFAENAHGETWNGPEGYTAEICHNVVFGFDSSVSNPHDCVGTSNLVLRLSGNTNAHGEIPEFSGGTPYTQNVCFGSLSCVSEEFDAEDYQDGGYPSCSSGRTAVVGLIGCKDTSGGTLEGTDCMFSNPWQAGEYSYPDTETIVYQNYLICCTSEVIGPVEWRSGTGEVLNLANVGDYVWMYTQAQGLEDEQVTFRVGEDDSWFDQDLNDILAEQGVDLEPFVDSNGEAIVYFQITEEIMNEVDCENTQMEFKFDVTYESMSALSSILPVNCVEQPSGPVANITGPIHGQVYYAGRAIDFTHSSFDTNGIIVNYLWEFNDGDISVSREESSIDGQDGNFQYIYNNPGLSTITLTVTDNEGLFDRDQVAILVIESPGIFGWIDNPGFDKVVEWPEGPWERGRVDFNAIESYVIDSSGSGCAETLTCVAGNCPSKTYSPPPNCDENISIDEGSGYGSFDSIDFQWNVNGEELNYDGNGIRNLYYVFGDFHSESIGDRNAVLKLIHGGIEMSETTERIFTLGQCLNDGTTFLEINGAGDITGIREFEDWGADSWDCSGAGGIGLTPNDCCPSFLPYCDDLGSDVWRCSGTDPSPDITDCNSYNNLDGTLTQKENWCINDCTLDEGNEWRLDCVGDTDSSAPACSDETLDEVSFCAWSNVQGEERCFPQRICPDGEGFSAECNFASGDTTSCVGGYMIVEYTLLDCLEYDADGNLIDYNGYDETNPWCGDNYDAECGSSYSAQVPCGRLDFELMFFNYKQFISVIVFVALIYLLLRFRRKWKK